MTSNNQWYVKGIITELNTRKRTVVMSIKGKIFRPNLYKVGGTIDCIIPRGKCKSLYIGEEVEVEGKIVFGEDNYMLVESAKNEKEVLFEKKLA